MSKLQPYGAAAMIPVSPRMSASNVTCIANGQQGDGAPDPGAVYDDHTERPEEVSSESQLTQLG